MRSLAAERPDSWHLGARRDQILFRKTSSEKQKSLVRQSSVADSGSTFASQKSGGVKMRSGKTKSKKIETERDRGGSAAVSYRLKCVKTANGLSHFVMYGDVSKEKTLL